ncbi:hypothetical protein B0I35DRAFT_431570 [Stachybotrys elegans]|uniref:Uncharacterized protein n=1 Tax=Stachybotrys elegans TaxID=80388 RepID=A0A8K0SQY8_9HYPO|nr:hypothetical protein B0I35DRAFT_431570 [Stachybotrys elegans]
MMRPLPLHRIQTGPLMASRCSSTNRGRRMAEYRWRHRSFFRDTVPSTPRQMLMPPPIYDACPTAATSSLRPSASAMGTKPP